MFQRLLCKLKIMQNYYALIDGKNVFYLPVKDNKVTYENIRKIATGPRDDYTIGCLLDYICFKTY